MFIFVRSDFIKMIQILDKTFTPYLSSETINSAVTTIANQIGDDYADQQPVFVVVLGGAFMFAADFMKVYKHPCQIEFIKLTSYQGTNSLGEVKQIMGLSQSLKNKPVIILEDIVDTGNTIQKLIELFEIQEPESIKIASLFYKPEAYTKQIKIDYIGISIPNHFIVGYGLDYNQLGRNLPQIYQLNTNN